MGKSDDTRKLREEQDRDRERRRGLAGLPAPRMPDGYLEGEVLGPGPEHVFTSEVAERLVEAGSAEEVAVHRSQEEFDELRGVPARGRPKRKEDTSPRTAMLQSMVTTDEYVAYEDRARKLGQTLSSWTRMVLNKAVGR